MQTQSQEAGAITGITSVLSFSVLSGERALGHLLQDHFLWLQHQLRCCFWRWHFKQHLFNFLLWKQPKQSGGLCDSGEPSRKQYCVLTRETLHAQPPSSARSTSTSTPNYHWKITTSARQEYSWVWLNQKPPFFDQHAVCHTPGEQPFTPSSCQRHHSVLRGTRSETGTRAARLEPSWSGSFP